MGNSTIAKQIPLLSQETVLRANAHNVMCQEIQPTPPPPLGWSEAVQLSPELTILRGHSRRHTLFAAGHTTGHPCGSRVST